jgi:hypothetical protein
MNIFKNKILWAVVIFLALIGGIFFVFENHRLNVAHSTFENYYAFRGCSELVEKTDTSARCKLSDSSVITLVKINDKWYLEGDGPGVW